ncbi:hypothetical protein ACFPH8_11445 [Bizionia hallyeonensis]|uniref:Positive regulator of sigma(E), RseC/MucC n=1 Tax=Bizionia hallyeonensis TaxID=1123757 RepID=A0ABW0C6V6_9FLAO
MVDIILNTKKINYSSNLKADSLKNKIEELFNQSNSTFVGDFTNQNKFSVYDKWSVIAWDVPNFKRKSAYLEGEILKSAKGTLLNLNMRPNTMLSVGPILAVLFGIILIIATRLNTGNSRFQFIGLFFILVGILYYALGSYSRNRLLNNFEKNLGLQKI